METYCSKVISENFTLILLISNNSRSGIGFAAYPYICGGKLSLGCCSGEAQHSEWIFFSSSAALSWFVRHRVVMGRFDMRLNFI